MVTGSPLRIVLAALLTAVSGSLQAQEPTPESQDSLVVAQQPPGADLTLERALELARRNNPAFQVARNQRVNADWNVKSAWGTLVPQLSVNAGASWQGAGSQQFGSITSDQLGFTGQPSFYFSNYGLAVNYDVNGRSVLRPSQSKAQREATDADIRTSEAQLVLGVTQTYLNVLLEIERLRVAREELERSQYNLRLAQGRREVGSATIIDVQQAEVAVGRAEVQILVTESARTTQRFELLRRLGLDLNQDFVLTSAGFELFEPAFDAPYLYNRALDYNPGLAALRANRNASNYDVKIAKSTYLPSLNFFANMSGFTRQASNTDFAIAQAQSQARTQMQQCAALNELFVRLADPLPTQDCSAFAFTDEQQKAIEASNGGWPFSFDSQPSRVGFSINLPLFQGLNRQRDVEAAQVARSDLDYRIREQELAVQAEIGAGLTNLVASYQAALIEQRNQSLADEQLRLAREQYQLGFTSFVELIEAETVKAQADRELIAAVFSYHDNLARLEAVVGTSLRP